MRRSFLSGIDSKGLFYCCSPCASIQRHSHRFFICAFSSRPPVAFRLLLYSAMAEHNEHNHTGNIHNIGSNRRLHLLQQFLAFQSRKGHPRADHLPLGESAGPEGVGLRHGEPASIPNAALREYHLSRLAHLGPALQLLLHAALPQAPSFTAQSQQPLPLILLLLYLWMYI